VSRLGKKLGGDTTRTAEPNCPKQYSVCHNLTRSSKTGVAEEEGVRRKKVSSKMADAWRLAGHQSACGRP